MAPLVIIYETPLQSSRKGYPDLFDCLLTILVV